MSAGPALLVRHRWLPDDDSWRCVPSASALGETNERSDPACDGGCGAKLSFAEVKNPPKTAPAIATRLDLEWSTFVARLDEDDPIRQREEKALNEADQKFRDADAALHPLLSLPSKPKSGDLETALREFTNNINGADPLRRGVLRAAAIAHLKELDLSSPAALVDAALKGIPKEAGCTNGTRLLLEDPEPWPEPVDGGTVLDEIVSLLERFIILPPGAASAIALWVVHAHALDAFPISPFLALCSATKRCGKTITLTLTSFLSPRPLLMSSLTPATAFRTIESFRPSLFVDEMDNVFRDEKSELRTILNASHFRPIAMVPRCIGDENEPRLFRTWSAKALALIGDLPPTLADRSIVIRLRRRAPSEGVESFDLATVLALATPSRRKATRWAEDNESALTELRPDAPEGLSDRARDNWNPLLAIADLAGPTWGERARHSALVLSGATSEADGEFGIQLLADIEELYRERGSDRLSSEEIAEHLGELEDRPWMEWRRGNRITKRQLARLLKPFGVEPKQLRVGGAKTRGYDLADFSDAFGRYTPSRYGTSGTPQENQQVTSDSDTVQTPSCTVSDLPLTHRKETPVPLVPIQKGGASERKPYSPPAVKQLPSPVDVLRRYGHQNRLAPAALVAAFAREGGTNWQVAEAAVELAVEAGAIDRTDGYVEAVEPSTEGSMLPGLGTP